MKFSLLQENLSPALSSVSRFVSAKSQLPILSNILFSTDNGRLKLSATNLELGINYWIGAKIEVEGSFAIPAHEITEFISYLSPGKIDFELNAQSLLQVVSQKAQSSFATIPPADFPALPGLNPDSAIELDLSVLTESSSQVSFAAASDDTRPVLTAVLTNLTPDSLSLVATDGFRLSTKNIKLVNPITLPNDQKSITLLVPSRSLGEIIKLARNTKKIKFGLSPDSNQLIFILDDTEIVSRLIDGDFPDYQRIIPSSFATKIKLSRDELSQGVKIASVFAKESANVVKFSLKNNQIEITANAPQIGQNKAVVEASIEGESVEIAFNYKFISDFLNICRGEEVTIELNESLTPALFRDQSDPHFTHIIMPVRIQD
jgi:DNA polymerase-3 subunit beta